MGYGEYAGLATRHSKTASKAPNPVPSEPPWSIPAEPTDGPYVNATDQSNQLQTQAQMLEYIDQGDGDDVVEKEAGSVKAAGIKTDTSQAKAEKSPPNLPVKQATKSQKRQPQEQQQQQPLTQDIAAVSDENETSSDGFVAGARTSSARARNRRDPAGTKFKQPITDDQARAQNDDDTSNVDGIQERGDV
eukprot:jgi/Hompol1/3270/HPOL_006438-RA